jgi:ABC-type antimicrobial peptide transport system permease subunit
MIKISLRGLLTRKLRATLTGVAVVLGVAMVCGTYVLTDTIDAAFHEISSNSYKNVSAVVTAKKTISMSSQTPTVPQSLLARVAALDGVHQATGSVTVISAPIIGRDGKPISTGGAPALGMGYSNFETKPDDPTKIAAGRWPTGANEVLIDAGTAKEQGFKVGDEIKVAYSGPAQQFKLVGYATYGSSDSMMGGTTFAVFNLSTAQKLFGLQGKLTEIDIEADSGASPSQIVSEVKPLLKKGEVVRTAEQQIKEFDKEFGFFIDILRYLLLAFGLIAVFVGAFVIFNTLSITVAQRTRELATLRTLGASGRQVLGGVLVEGLTIGAVASLVGLGLGVLIAKGLNALFEAVGANIPHTGTIFASRTVLISLIVGMTATLVASLVPALRATRVPPIAAVREGAILPKRAHVHIRNGFAVLIIIIASLALFSGLFGGSVSVSQRLITLGVGCLLLFLGVALVSSYVVRPLARVASPIAAVVGTLVLALIWIPITLPYWLLRYAVFTRGSGKAARRIAALLAGFVIGFGPLLFLLVLVMRISQALTSWEPEWPTELLNPITALRSLWPASKAGQAERVSRGLGTHNARRNPQRTAATSAALMIGIALVTFVTVLTGGFTRSTEVAVNDNVTADFVVTSIDGQSPMGNKVTSAIAGVKGVTNSVAIQIDYGKVGRSTAAISGIDPKEIGSVWRLKWKQGSNASLNRLHGRNALLIESFAKKKKLKVGDNFTFLPPSGKKLRLHVVAIDKQPMYLAALGDITISSQTFDRAVAITPQTTIATLVRTTGGASDASRATLERALKNYPTVKVMTKKQYINLVNKGFVQIQTMFWILLALSLLISVFGIINTLVLAVFERTRELGMLRAVGLTKRQTRGMIRHESITISLIGAALGMPLGVLLAGLVIAALSKYGVVFSLPWGLLIVFVIVTVVFGMLAAILPARRAAKLNVLEALQYE